MRAAALICLSSLCACITASELTIYDATETITEYDCPGRPAPSGPYTMVIALDEQSGRHHLYTCDDTCSQKTETGSSSDGVTFTYDKALPADARGCAVQIANTASVTRSGRNIEIEWLAVTDATDTCDLPGKCTVQSTVVGTQR